MFTIEMKTGNFETPVDAPSRRRHADPWYIELKKKHSQDQSVWKAFTMQANNNKYE